MAITSGYKRPVIHGMIALYVLAIRLLLASLLVGALASAPLAVSSGCGGCGIDDIKATVSPATSCLKVSAQRGWGCDSTALIEGDNRCPQAVTISKAGTELTADQVVAPNSAFSIDVIRAPTGEIQQKSFAISIGGQTGTIDVAW
jgi:hypothetical protein